MQQLAASANAKLADLRRILVVRNDRIGDLVLTFPALEALRHALPHSHITLLASRYAGPLAEGYPAIDDVWLDDPAWNAWRLAARLRAGRFDAALVINTNTRNSLAVLASGIRRRVCWAYKPIGWLAATDRVALRRSHPPVHEAEFALAFVRQLGIEANLSELAPRLPIDRAARESIAERIQRQLGGDGPLFGIHPGNKQSAYNWPPARYGELAAQLAARGRVLLTGGPAEADLLAAVRAGVPQSLAHRVAIFTDLSLEQLAAAIAQQAVLVVSSTGPMHLAGVVGTPTVALFSPHPAHVPAKWAPLGSGHTLLVAPLQPGENPAVPRARGGELMCRIQVDEVLQAALAAATNRRSQAA